MATKVLKRSKTGEIYHPGSNIVFTADKVAYGVLVNGKTESLGSEQVTLCNELGFKYDPKKVIGYQSETSGEEEESSDDGEDGSGEEAEEVSPQPVPVVDSSHVIVPVVDSSHVSEPVVAPQPIVDQTVRSCVISPRKPEHNEPREGSVPCENTFLAMMKKMHLDATVTLPERDRELASTKEQLASTQQELTSTKQQLASVQAKFDIIRSAFN